MRFILAAILVLPSIAFAGRVSDELVRQWDRDLAGIEALLLNREWSEATKESERLSERMVALIVGGTGEAHYLGAVTALRAIALAGEGRVREAHWFWQVAQQLFPDTDRELPFHFDPRVHFLQQPPSTPDITQPDDVAASVEAGHYVPPTIKHKRKPKFPKAEVEKTVNVRVEVIIDDDGVVYQPRILESAGELTMVLAVLDAMSHWRYVPMEVHGKPIGCKYVVTFHFKGA